MSSYEKDMSVYMMVVANRVSHSSYGSPNVCECFVWGLRA